MPALIFNYYYYYYLFLEIKKTSDAARRSTPCEDPASAGLPHSNNPNTLAFPGARGIAGQTRTSRQPTNPTPTRFRSRGPLYAYRSSSVLSFARSHEYARGHLTRYFFAPFSRRRRRRLFRDNGFIMTGLRRASTLATASGRPLSRAPHHRRHSSASTEKPTSSLSSLALSSETIFFCPFLASSHRRALLLLSSIPRLFSSFATRTNSLVVDRLSEKIVCPHINGHSTRLRGLDTWIFESVHDTTCNQNKKNCTSMPRESSSRDLCRFDCLW